MAPGGNGSCNARLTRPSVKWPSSNFFCSSLGLPSPRLSLRFSPRPSPELGALRSHLTYMSSAIPMRWYSSTRFTSKPSIWNRWKIRIFGHSWQHFFKMIPLLRASKMEFYSHLDYFSFSPSSQGQTARWPLLRPCGESSGTQTAGLGLTQRPRYTGRMGSFLCCRKKMTMRAKEYEGMPPSAWQSMWHSCWWRTRT